MLGQADQVAAFGAQPRLRVNQSELIHDVPDPVKVLLKSGLGIHRKSEERFL
ncbi:MAG: hypothetical protein QOD35_3458 [Nocardioidaceae bacterium]|nr:hypothetical protein [Nocardioidaceae bacterium]